MRFLAYTWLVYNVFCYSSAGCRVGNVVRCREYTTYTGFQFMFVSRIQFFVKPLIYTFEIIFCPKHPILKFLSNRGCQTSNYKCQTVIVRLISVKCQVSQFRSENCQFQDSFYSERHFERFRTTFWSYEQRRSGPS